MPSSGDYKSDSPCPDKWSSLSAKEKAEYYYRTQSKDYTAPNMQSSYGDGCDVDSRESVSYVRPYAYVENSNSDRAKHQHRQPPSTDDDNPFIAFRRYADSQLSSLLQSVIGLPSMFGSPAKETRWQEVGKAKQRANEMHSWGGASDTEEWERSKILARDSVEKPSDKSVSDSIGCPYLLEHGSEMEDNVREVQDLFSDHTLDELSYLACSPYSPLQLADDPRFSDNIDKWTKAYEELVDNGSQQRRHGRVSDMLALHDRPQRVCENLDGYLGTYNLGLHPSRKMTDREREDAETELDLYENLLKSRHHSKFGNAPEDNSNEQTSEVSSSRLMSSTSDKSTPQSIISTLTTMERRTLPDGTVHTKVVLKKRFADGKEESTETVLKSRGDQSGGQKGQPHLAKKEVHSTDNTKEVGTKKKGWFWSD